MIVILDFSFWSRHTMWDE